MAGDTDLTTQEQPLWDQVFATMVAAGKRMSDASAAAFAAVEHRRYSLGTKR